MNQGPFCVTVEYVARKAVRDAREYLVSNAVAGEHLTDQLLSPLASAGEGSFTALKCNGNALINMKIIE